MHNFRTRLLLLLQPSFVGRRRAYYTKYSRWPKKPNKVTSKTIVILYAYLAVSHWTSSRRRNQFSKYINCLFSLLPDNCYFCNSTISLSVVGCWSVCLSARAGIPLEKHSKDLNSRCPPWQLCMKGSEGVWMGLWM